MKKKQNSKMVAKIGMYVALAFVLSYVETLLPVSFAIPGIKLGLSNLVVLLSIYQFSLGTAFLIALVRIVLCGMTFGSLSTMMYSAAGGLLSFVIMILMKKAKNFSVFSVSIAGGITHNLGQILMAIFILRTSRLFYYFPFLLLAGFLAGTAIGSVGSVLIKRLSTLSEFHE